MKSTANAVGVGLSMAYGILVAALAIANVRGTAYLLVIVIGAGLLAIYWVVGRRLFS